MYFFVPGKHLEGMANHLGIRPSERMPGFYIFNCLFRCIIFCQDQEKRNNLRRSIYTCRAVYVNLLISLH